MVGLLDLLLRWLRRRLFRDWRQDSEALKIVAARWKIDPRSWFIGNIEADAPVVLL